MSTQCPKCHAPLQENAAFCPHCMTQLLPRQNVDKPPRIRNRRKRLAIAITALILAVAVLTAGIVGVISHIRHSPICDFATFEVTVPFVSARMGINDLWDVGGFTDTHSNPEKKLVRYNTDVYLGDAELSLFFYNKGEEIEAYISDISAEHYDEAESLLKCVVQSVENYFMSDIDAVFDDEDANPKKELDKPFDSYFTDFVNRTKQYDADVENGATFTTKWIVMQCEKDGIVFLVLERDYGDTVLYDMAVEIARI